MDNRSVNLDLLRILAAFLVVLLHISMNFSTTFDFPQGYAGVYIFFLIGGYLSGYSMKGRTAKEFYKKRMVRILPLYYLALVLYLLSSVVIKRGVTNPPFSVKFLRFFFCINMWLPSDDFYAWNNIQGWWFISVIMFFYLLTPLIHRFINSFLRSLIAVTVILLFSLPLQEFLIDFIPRVYPAVSEVGGFVDNSPVGEMDWFMLGVLVYYAIKEKKESQCMMLLIVTTILTGFHFCHEQFFYTMALLGMTMVPGVVKSPRIVSAIGKLGSATYTIYLFHLMVLSVLAKIAGRIGINDGILYVVILFCAAIIGCVIIHMAIGYVTRWTKGIPGISK